ncbi:MAG: hypothetical protein HY756_05370 [Nitrospirae bacterium]|nr:hypothetical protein [Nitrospirota bacterium]
MPIDNKTKILIASPIVLIIILAIIANYLNLEQWLKADTQRGMESGIQQLEVTPSDITKRQAQNAYAVKDLKGPIEFAAAPAAFPGEALDKVAPQAVDRLEGGISLIVIGEKKRMAIIKGAVIKEGDSIDGVRIVKIEPNRVLVKDKTTKWLYMEKIK